MPELTRSAPRANISLNTFLCACRKRLQQTPSIMQFQSQMDDAMQFPAATAPPATTSQKAPIPRRDKSLSALCTELIARYGQDGTVIDLDDVQVRAAPRGKFMDRPNV